MAPNDRWLCTFTLNQQYVSIFSKEEEDIPSKGVRSHPPMKNLNISKEGVTKLLKELNMNTASGPDKISLKVLNTLADDVAPHLTSIFTTFLETGRIPNQWKTALITSIFKKGDQNNTANYWPVSLTSICYNVCEDIIPKSIMQHLEDHGLLIDSNTVSGQSAHAQLLTLVKLLQGVATGKQYNLAIMGFSRAFDVVPHMQNKWPYVCIEVTYRQIYSQRKASLLLRCRFLKSLWYS